MSEALRPWSVPGAAPPIIHFLWWLPLVALGIVTAAALGSIGFAQSEQYRFSLTIIGFCTAAALVTALVGLVANWLTYRWCRQNEALLDSRNVATRMASERYQTTVAGWTSPILVGVVLGVVLYMFALAPTAHGFGRNDSYRGAVSVMEAGYTGRSFCPSIVVRNDDVGTLRVCVGRSLQRDLKEGDLVLVEGARSWFGMRIDRVSPTRDPV